MRAYITGTGAVTTFGLGTEAFFASCLQGSVNVSQIPDTFEQYTQFKSRIYSPHPKLDYSAHGFGRMEQMQHDPVALNALIAVDEAIQQAGISRKVIDERQHRYVLEGVNAERCAVQFGSGIGGASSMLDNYNQHILKAYRAEINDSNMLRLQQDLKQIRRVNPFVVSMTMANSVPASIGIKYGMKGPNQVYSLACASGTAAIGQAYELVKSGQADLVITGGAEYFSDFAGALMMSFDIAGTLVESEKFDDIETANRPFDTQRSGFLFSEGAAGALVVESEQHMLQRGAKPLCEIIGHAATFDAFSMMAMEDSAEQIIRMQQQLMAVSGIKSDQVDYINSHGTGTTVNDMVESQAIEQVFGQRPYVNSTKSIIGHSLGASGAMEAIVCVQSINQQRLHPNRNLENPINDLNYVSTQAIEAEIQHCMSESFAFGGHNIGLMFKAVD